MQEKVRAMSQIKNAAILQNQLSQIMLTSAIKQLYLTDICLEMLPFFVALENSETDDSSSYYYNLYHYAGNTPVKYTDPDGKKTTVLIIHADTGWEKFANGSHVAIFFSNPGKGSDGDCIEQTLYDPSGSYEAPTGYGTGRFRSSSGLFSGKESANLNDYIDSVLNRENDESIVSYTIDTTPEQEAAMIEKAEKKGDGWGFSCASNVSEVLETIGFKKVQTPGGLEKQLQQSYKVTETEVYKNENNE